MEEAISPETDRWQWFDFECFRDEPGIPLPELITWEEALQRQQKMHPISESK